ncbi:MAG: autotransporter-associated beta strand repeat-containing protein [bacterium]|nr:autotransporter-associated beta strand repeat-containing protein [bacterium]
MTVATGRLVWGDADDAASAPVYSSSSEITVGGVNSQGNAAFELNNGSVTEGNVFYLGYYGASLTPRATLSFIFNGGTFQAKNLVCAYNLTSQQNVNTEVVVNGGRGYVTGDVILGRSPAKTPVEQTCRWTQNGGVFGVKGNFHTCYWITNQTSKGLIDLNGGTLAVTGTVTFARAGKNTQDNAVDFRLNGGRLEVNAITQSVDAANTCFYGNGGILAPIGITAAGGCFGAVGKLYASTNGLVVDTSILAGKDKDYTISHPILHDPDAPAIDGGVTKQGAGRLTLSGANTFTGPLTVAGGTLRLLGPATVVPTLAFTGGTLDAVAPVEAGTLTGMGICQGALTVTGMLVPDVDAVVNVTGDFTLASTAKVDLAQYPAASLDYGDVVPLVAVLGTAQVPTTVPVTEASVGAHVSGQKFRLKISVGDDHVVYGTLASSGTMILLR